GGSRAPERGRELLRQRQTDGGGRGAAAVRRRPGERHQRQSGLDPESASVGVAPDDQGDVRSGHRLALPVHAGALTTTPAFITKRTRCISSMSLSGSPATATRSAYRPGATAPRASSWSSSRAAVLVPALRACIGVMP